ncbi:MAG: hypothetical protein ABSE07_05615 [Methanoregula sp.]|jgi:hypothetical protein
MKNADGQLYTIEGFAAALIMLMTAYLVVNATSVYTAGDTHISDMQLEALGSDALNMMGTPTNTTMDVIGTSPLRTIIEANPPDGEKFKAIFLNLTNNRTGAMPDYYSKIGSTMDYIQFNASYTCWDINNNVVSTNPISYSRNLTGGEHTVRATKWVIVNKAVCNGTKQDRAVLVEVLMWRD